MQNIWIANLSKLSLVLFGYLGQTGSEALNSRRTKSEESSNKAENREFVLFVCLGDLEAIEAMNLKPFFILKPFSMFYEP